MILSGYKTYIVAVAMIAYALFGYAIDDMTQPETARLLLEALGLAGLRAGVAKVG